MDDKSTTQPLEDGMIHPAEQIVIDALRAAIDFEAMVLYGSKCASRGDILRLLARSVKSLPHSVALWVEKLAIRVLDDHEVDVRDAAIYALEMIGSAGAITVLQAHVDPVPWLHGYAQHVARELMEESAMDAGQDLVEKHCSELVAGDPGFTEDWIVTGFNLDTLWGLVAKRSSPKYVLTFHSTSFGAPTRRWPIVGESVEVTFNNSGRLLAVHSK